MLSTRLAPCTAPANFAPGHCQLCSHPHTTCTPQQLRPGRGRARGGARQRHLDDAGQRGAAADAAARAAPHPWQLPRVLLRHAVLRRLSGPSNLVGSRRRSKLPRVLLRRPSARSWLPIRALAGPPAPRLLARASLPRHRGRGRSSGLSCRFPVTQSFPPSFGPCAGAAPAAPPKLPLPPTRIAGYPLCRVCMRSACMSHIPRCAYSPLKRSPPLPLTCLPPQPHPF